MSSSPVVGTGFYATFCENDPLTPSNVGDDDGSTGGMASGCLFSGGADGTGEGTDYDPDWPIESPDDLPPLPPDPDPVDPCHDHDALGGNHDPSLCPKPDPDPEPEPEPKPDPDPVCCDCKAEDNTCDGENCCKGCLFGLHTVQLVLMMIASAALLF